MFLVIGVFSTDMIAQSKIGRVIWQLAELNGKALAESRVYIEFDDEAKRFSGNAGCNRFFGGYEREGRSFRVNGAGSARMECLQPGAMETESEFLKLLGDATRMRRSGQTLSMFAGGERVLRFKMRENALSASTIDLGSKRWVLKSIGSTPVTIDTTQPFLIFDPVKMSVDGNSGCNGFGGCYPSSGDELAIGDVISTMMACEAEGRMEFERGLFEGPHSASRLEIKDGQLSIYAGSMLLLEFEGTAK